MPQAARVIVGAVLLVIGLGILASSILMNFMLPETFASTVRIVTGVHEPTSLQTQIEQLGSSRILGQVITNLNLNKKWAEHHKEENDFRTEQTIGILRSQTAISQVNNTDLIQITVRNQNPIEAASIANEIAKVYASSALAAKGPPVQILEAAQPSLRPERPNSFGLIAGLIFIGCGVVVIFKPNAKRP